jgi:hypothetical protein
MITECDHLPLECDLNATYDEILKHFLFPKDGSSQVSSPRPSPQVEERQRVGGLPPQRLLAPRAAQQAHRARTPVLVRQTSRGQVEALQKGKLSQFFYVGKIEFQNLTSSSKNL